MLQKITTICTNVKSTGNIFSIKILYVTSEVAHVWNAARINPQLKENGKSVKYTRVKRSSLIYVRMCIDPVNSKK